MVPITCSQRLRVDVGEHMVPISCSQGVEVRCGVAMFCSLKVWTTYVVHEAISMQHWLGLTKDRIEHT